MIAPRHAAPWRLRIGRRLPAGLGTLLVMVAIVGIVWALVLPPWQAPDENSHFAYVQSVAETLKLPTGTGGTLLSSDQNLGATLSGSGFFAWPMSAAVSWFESDWDAYRTEYRQRDPSRTDGGGANPAASNPPLYYLVASIPYLIVHSANVFGRLYAIRLFGVLMLMATTIGAWLLAGEVLGRRRLPQLVCAAVVGLWPMTTFIATNVNPDALVNAASTFVLWLGARVINRRAQTWDAVALCAVTAVAILAKYTSYAVVPAVLLALLIGWLRRPAEERAATARTLGGALTALVVPVGIWLGLTRVIGRAAVNQISSPPGQSSHPVNIREFLSYVWQFYLPRLPFMTQQRYTSDVGGGWPFYDYWVRQAVGNFGWLTVFLPAWIYTATAAVAGVVAATAIWILAQVRDRPRLALLMFFLVAAVTVVGLVHVADYLNEIRTGFPLVQGRYLLPLIGLLGLAVALVVSRLPTRVRPAGAGFVLTGLLALQAVSLAAVIQVFYL